MAFAWLKLVIGMGIAPTGLSFRYRCFRVVQSVQDYNPFRSIYRWLNTWLSW